MSQIQGLFFFFVGSLRLPFQVLCYHSLTQDIQDLKWDNIIQNHCNTSVNYYNSIFYWISCRKYVFQLNQGHVIKTDAIGLQKLKTLWCCLPPKNFASLNENTLYVTLW